MSTDIKALADVTFKLLAHWIMQSNTSVEKIKREQHTSYKPLCNNKPSATQLFGDKLQGQTRGLKDLQNLLRKG